MSAEIRQVHPDVDIELVPGSRGAFNVAVDGTDVWNKHRDGGFPPAERILDAMRR